MGANKNYAYRNQWNKENLDRINLTMEKGKKAIIKSYAEKHGESLNGFINRAIDKLIAEDDEVRENS